MLLQSSNALAILKLSNGTNKKNKGKVRTQRCVALLSATLSTLDVNYEFVRRNSMIVKPRKISKKLKSNEIRVININHHAIEELLWENLMEHQAEYFDIDKIDDDLICQMQWDREKEILTYVVMPISYMYNGKQLDFSYIRENIGLTATSLFQTHRYRRLCITDMMFEDN